MTGQSLPSEVGISSTTLRRAPLTSRRFWLALAIVASGIAAVQLPRAFLAYFHVWPPRITNGHVDLDRRWQEVQYVFHGENPYDVLFANSARARSVEPPEQTSVGRFATVDPGLGLPDGVDYPPWAFTTEALFVWLPSRQSQEFFYSVLMCVGLAIVFVWVYHQLKNESPLAAYAVGMAALAAASWVTSIVVGNFPPVLLPLLIACHTLLNSRKDVAAGLVLGVAMLKPTVAGPFFLVLLVKRRWAAAAVCAAWVCATSAVTWALTHTDPLHMLVQMFVASKLWIGDGFGPAQYLMSAGVPPFSATATTAVAFLLLGLYCLWLLRDRSMLALFSIAAITSRFWSYHMYYDDAFMLFALVFLAREIFASGQRIAMLAFCLACLALWVPHHIALIPALQILQLCTWLLLAFVVLRLSLVPSAEQRELQVSLA